MPSYLVTYIVIKPKLPAALDRQTHLLRSQRTLSTRSTPTSSCQHRFHHQVVVEPTRTLATTRLVLRLVLMFPYVN